MVARFLNLILIISMMVATAIPQVSVAQAAGANTKKSSTGGPKKQLSIIVFSGVAGAILGLSTLSFYGRPQTKLVNIAIGAAFGIITGAIYSTYKTAAEPHDFYKDSSYHQSTFFQEEDRDRELRYAHGNSPLKASVTVLTF